MGESLYPSPGDPVVSESWASSFVGDTDQSVEDAYPDRRSSSNPVIWESSASDFTPSTERRSEDAPLRPLLSNNPVLWESPPSNSAGGSGSDYGVEDGLLGSRASGDPVIWESSSSDLTPESEQCAEDAPPPPSLTSDEPVIWESSSSNSAGGSDRRIEDESPDSRSCGDSSGDPVIWESSSSDSTKTSEQSAGSANPNSLASGDPAIWEPSSSDSMPAPPVIWESSSSGSTQVSQPCVEDAAPPGPLYFDKPFTWEASTTASCVSTLSLCDEDYGELTPDLVRRIRYYRSRLERSAEQELLAQTGGEAFLLSSSPSTGVGAATTAAVTAAVEERTAELCNGGGGTLSAIDDAIAADGEAREQFAKANWLSGPSEDVAVESPSPSSGRVSTTTIRETPTSDAESEKHHAATADPADNVTNTTALEEKLLELKMPSMWLADPLEAKRDPLGDVP